MTPASLLSCCHVCTNQEGDRFVGIRIGVDGARVTFPLGYQLPTEEQGLRRDILHLLAVLSAFTSRDEGSLAAQTRSAEISVPFPVHAYLTILQHFMEQGSYYTESEPHFRIGNRGRVDWGKTLRKMRPLLQPDGTPAYTQYILRVSRPNEQNLVTQIHQYCVYESFLRIGWLFTPYLPEKPTLARNDRLFLTALREKLATTHNDRDKRLFAAMIAMIESMDGQDTRQPVFFGTDRFEYVWERLIDRVFGIRAKADYFPKTRWTLRTRQGKTNAALEPDTIMLLGGKIYVLDAKYYKFGATGNPNDLPESGDINKQITYGEHIHQHHDAPVYNAFLMPYNRHENRLGIAGDYENIGEATGDWKASTHPYAHVQGIVIDVRHLMYHFAGETSRQMQALADAIEAAFTACIRR